MVLVDTGDYSILNNSSRLGRKLDPSENVRNLETYMYIRSLTVVAVDAISVVAGIFRFTRARSWFINQSISESISTIISQKLSIGKKLWNRTCSLTFRDFVYVGTS